MSSLTEIREILIGVHTHVDTGTGGKLAEIMVPTISGNHQELLDLVEEHCPLREWAIEGTGGHAAGLTRLLEHEAELVLELDRAPGCEAPARREV